MVSYLVSFALLEMLRSPSDRSTVYHDLDADEVSWWERILCNRWGSSKLEDTRNCLRVNFLFVVLSVLDAGVALCVGSRLDASQWWSLLDNAVSLPLLGVLLYRLTLFPDEPPHRVFVWFAMAASTIFFAALVFDGAQALSSVKHARFWLFVVSSCADVCSLYTWLNITYLIYHIELAPHEALGRTTRIISVFEGTTPRPHGTAQPARQYSSPKRNNLPGVSEQ